MLHSICQQIWKTHQWPQDWKRSVFIPIPKKGNAKECSNYCTIALISHASKVMLKILQAPGFSNTWTMNFLIFKLVLEKAEEPEIKLPISIGSSKKWEFQKNTDFCFIGYTKVFVSITAKWQILQKMGIPDHLTCFLRNLYAEEEAMVRTGRATTEWFKSGKEVRQGCLLSLSLFNLYAEWIIQNAGLDDSQAGIKIAGRNINNLTYADDSTLMASPFRIWNSSAGIPSPTLALFI